MILPTPPPPFTPTLAPRVDVVTLTVTSGSSTATLQPSSRGGSSVPIGAIAGGAAGGVTLAVMLVLVWKYWGLVIKRDERKRRKEVVRTYRISAIVTLVTDGLISPCSKTCSPCARIPGGTHRLGSSPNHNIAQCSRSTLIAGGSSSLRVHQRRHRVKNNNSAHHPQSRRGADQGNIGGERKRKRRP
jgi:hypothetical protein